jgi:serine/threonine-protein kinase
VFLTHYLSLGLALAQEEENGVKRQVVATLAGSGMPAFSGGAGVQAAFNQPFGMCVDAEGNLYVADSANHCVRKVSPAGVVTTVAGAGGEKGTVDGPATKARFNTPSGVLAEAGGKLYVWSYVENSIRLIDARGKVRSVVAARQTGYRDGPVSKALVYAPRGLVVDSKGTVFFSDCWNHRIRKISPDGIVSTLAGGGPTGVDAKATWRDGTGAEARFYAPCGMAIDKEGNLYVADAENHRIRKVTAAGVVTTLAGHGASGKEGRGFADGPAARSRLNTPTELFVASDSSVYFSDTYGNRIRKINPQGIVSTISGSGEPGLVNGALDKARFNFPRGLVVWKNAVFVADYNNHAIRMFVLVGR